MKKRYVFLAFLIIAILGYLIFTYWPIFGLQKKCDISDLKIESVIFNEDNIDIRSRFYPERVIEENIILNGELNLFDENCTYSLTLIKVEQDIARLKYKYICKREAKIKLSECFVEISK